LLKTESKGDNFILETQEDFCEFLKYLIEDVGMQKIAITRNLGINRMTIQKILRGQIPVTKRSLRLANIYLNKMQKQFFIPERKQIRLKL
jgi:predicted transcriptional regulator